MMIACTVVRYATSGVIGVRGVESASKAKEMELCVWNNNWYIIKPVMFVQCLVS